MQARRRGEDGQLLIIASLSMVAVLAMTSLAVDAGFFFHTKRELQNSADAMALAGAAAQPDDSESNSLAAEWADKNDVAASEIVSITFDATCSGDPEANSVTVRLKRNQKTFLARVLGITDGDVNACATAGRYALGGSIGLAPWSVENDCVWGPNGEPGGGDDPLTPGEIVTLKYDADNTGADCDQHTGNFSPIAIDETGAGTGCDASSTEGLLKYAQAICFGSKTALCSADAIDPGCSTTVDTETGNLIGKTRDSVLYLFDIADPNCLTWDAMVDETVTPWELAGECKPWVPGNNPVSIVKLIPVVDGLWDGGSGHHTVDVVGFLIVILEPIPSPVSSWCTGNDCDVVARIFDFDAVPSSFRAPLDDSSNLTFVTLLE